MDARSPSRARAAGLCGALVALAATAACASRTPSTTSAATPGSAAAAASSPSDAATPAPTSLGSSSSRAAAASAAPPTATADAHVPITCTATVSNPSPKRGMPTHVIVQTASGAQVSLAASSRAAAAMVAPQRAVNADAAGRADITVTSQAADLKVSVQVQATKAGATASCATSFTPVDLPQATNTPGLPPIQVTTQPIPPANNNT